MLKFTFTQKRQIEVAQDKNAALHRKKITDLMAKINQYKLPLYFYDFESVQTPVPYFIYTTPFQQIVFQYALYAIPMPNRDEEFYYYEYISPHADDFRLTIIDKLITDLFRFGVGKYVVYNKVFECQRLEEWADYLSYLISQPNTTTSAKKHYRVLSNKIQLIIENTLDLMEFFSRFDIYYLSFQGRYSIKKTLPALVENFSYQDLKVRKGDQASELFYRLLVGNVNQYF